MSRSSATHDRHDALLEAIEALTQQVHVVVQAVDDLACEVQWRNNNAPDTCTRPAALRVHSMPVDPAATDWVLNQSGPEDLPPALRATGTLFD